MSEILIKELTPEQEASMAGYAQKWIEIGLRTGETDWDTFDKYMPICYEKADLQYPKNVVRVQSPLVGALAASVAEGIFQKRRKGAVYDAVGGAVGDAVDRAVYGAVGGAVYDAVDRAVRDAVRGAVGGAVDGAVGGAVDGAVDGAVYDAVGGAVGDAVDRAVRDAVRGAVGGAVDGAVETAVSIAKKAGIALNWHYWLGGQFGVSWGWGYWGVAFCNFFFDICKLKLAKDIMERAEAYRKVCESVNYIWPNRDFVMVCARPTKILRDEAGRLHCDNGKAIEYPDGWGLYLLHGVRFPETLFKQVTSGEMPFEKIMAIEDIDQRTQAMRFGDPQKFLKHTSAKKLDERIKFTPDGRKILYQLYMIPQGEIFTEDAYYVIYDCPSTDRKYMSGVEPCKTVAEAMSWKFNVSEEQWAGMKPLVHES